MDLRAAVCDATKQLKAAEVHDAQRDASLLIASVLKTEPHIVHLQPEREISDAELQNFNKLVARRTRREPMSHILGHREFWSLDFLVSPDVLDPRPDSETLIEAALKAVKEGLNVTSILDLGTGSGCLLLTLLSEIEGAVGLGVDISDAALNVAKKNSIRLGLKEATSFRQNSWCDGITDNFDLVVSNPPYIPAKDINDLQPEVRDFEPRLALDGGGDGLDCYRRILSTIDTVLRPGGLLLFELGVGQASTVAELMQEVGLSGITRYCDLAGIERVIGAYKLK